MAALTTDVGTTELTEWIPTEILPSIAQSFEYAARTAEAIAWTKPGAGSIAHRFIRWNQLNAGAGVPAGTKTESDTFTDVLLDLAESSITPGIVGFRLPVPDESMRQTVIGPMIQTSLAVEALNAINDRRDSDVLSSITSATNTAGAATDNFTIQKAVAALAAWRALNVPDIDGGVAFLLHHDGFRDLEADTSATSAPFVPTQTPGDMFGVRAGVKGMWMGALMIDSGNAPANASNWSGCITAIGNERSGLGLVDVESPNIRTSRGDDAENRAVTYLIVRSWYGAGLTNPNRILEVLHRT